jgi:hypothetical protein
MEGHNKRTCGKDTKNKGCIKDDDGVSGVTKRMGKLELQESKIECVETLNLNDEYKCDSSLPSFNNYILHEPENIEKLVKELEAKYPKYKVIADIVKMTLESKSTNDFLEKIAVESIGFRHLTDKLGPDGVDPTNENIKLEAKPSKGTFKAVINDDTPNKLLKSKQIQLIIFLNANKSGNKVNYVILAPFSAWDNSRYNKICEHLKLEKDDTWKYDCKNLPENLSEKEKVLTELVNKHVPKQYVRSSPLNLEVLNTIPKEKIRVWKHDDFPNSKLPKSIQSLF